KIKEEVPEGEYVIPLGKAAVRREGTHASIIAYGSAVHFALDAAAELEKDGMSIEVVDIRTLVPFDEDTVLQSVKKTGRVLIAHEASITGGFGGEIAARIADKAFNWLDAPVKRIGAYDSPTPFAPTLEKAVLPNTEKVLAAMRELLAF
ncbi:MAG: hypothetical protein JNL32_16170, partial [Candidatus Kapabacteria bacterium]|nr:hypothetical protein [Candidatus Kapabacteria bacterium]